MIRGNLFSEYKFTTDFTRRSPRSIKHPKSLFLDPLSCILDDGESTPNRPKQGMSRALFGLRAGREEFPRIPHEMENNDLLLSHEEKANPPSCCGILEPIFFKHGPKRSVPSLFPATLVRATHEKHVHKTVYERTNVQSLARKRFSRSLYERIL